MSLNMVKQSSNYQSHHIFFNTIIFIRLIFTDKPTMELNDAVDKPIDYGE